MSVTTSGIEVVVRRRRVVEQRRRGRTPSATSPESVSAPCVGTCVSISEQRDPEQRPARGRSRRAAGPRGRRARAACETAPRAPGSTMPGMEDLEAEPGDPGQEEQRDDVRVEQRREEPRDEARASTFTISAPAVWSVRCAGTVVRPSICVQQRRQGGRDQVDHVHAAAPRRRSGSRRPGRPCRPRRRCGRGSSRARAARRRRR